MSSRSVAAALFVAALLPASAFAEEDDVVRSPSMEISGACVGELMKFADTAAKKGYVTLARRSLAQLGRIRSSTTGADERMEQLRGQDDAPKLSAKARAGLEKQFTKVRLSVAKRMAGGLDDVAAEHSDTAAKDWAQQILQFDPDSAAARARLGHSKQKGWGWVTEEEAAHFKAGELPIGDDGWVKKSDVGRDPRPWGEHWRMRSDHFRVYSNLPLKRVQAATVLLEALRERFLADWEGTLPLVEKERIHDVYVFAEKSEYEAYLNANDPGHIKGVPGQYSPTYHRSTFFDVETLRAAGGQTSSLEELMLHECAHQLFHELVKIDAVPIDANSSANGWLNEGTAEYYGMHTMTKNGLVLDRKAIRGMLRTVHMKKSASLVLPATELASLTKGTFQSDGGEQRVTNYATAGFLCLYLSEGATRGPWQRLVRAFFCEGNPKDAFMNAMGEHAKGLDEGFAKFLGKL